MVAGAGVVVKLERDNQHPRKEGTHCGDGRRRQTWQRVKVVSSTKSRTRIYRGHIA